MDLRLSHEISTQLIDIYTPPPLMKINLRTRLSGRPYDAEKRYATYFPFKPNFDTDWEAVDDESTWEFSASEAHVARSFSPDSCSSMCTTAAQEIASRYRAGMPLQAVLSGFSSKTVSSGESDVSSWPTDLEDSSITSESEVPPPVPAKDHLVTPRCKSFRDKELSTSLQEALEIIKRDGRHDSHPLVCHRPGCHDVIRNVEAFMYHLHIHNIHDETLQCHSCNKQFSHGFQLRFHCYRCEESRFRSPLTSPLKEYFFHVFSRLSSSD